MIRHSSALSTCLCASLMLFRPAGAAELTSAAPAVAHTEEPVVQTDAEAPPHSEGGPSVEHRASLDFSALWTDDIVLTDTALQFRQIWSRAELSLTLSHGHIGLDYVPEPSAIFKSLHPTYLSDEHYGVQTSERFRLSAPLTLLVGGGLYQGYTDYASLWLNEFYQQLAENYRDLDIGYREADPWGWNTAAGLRWEYVPGTAFLQADLRYNYDVIAPGYNLSIHYYPVKLVRNQDQLDTISGHLALENVLSARMRSLLEFQAGDTTGRELRFTLQGSLNWAIGEHWVLRPVAGGSKEEPKFEAWWTGLTLEHDWNNTWFVSLMGRYYSDTGQIENSLPSNVAAPPVDTLETGLGLRWQGRKSSAKLVVGPYWSRYDEAAAKLGGFSRLYSSRDWVAVQFAFSHRF